MDRMLKCYITQVSMCPIHFSCDPFFLILFRKLVESPFFSSFSFFEAPFRLFLAVSEQCIMCAASALSDKDVK